MTVSNELIKIEEEKSFFLYFLSTFFAGNIKSAMPLMFCKYTNIRLIIRKHHFFVG